MAISVPSSFVVTLLSGLLLFLSFSPPTVHGQSTTCAVCVVLLTVLEQQNLTSSSPNPEVTCKDLAFCDGTCSLFQSTGWPVVSPDFPTDGEVDDSRRLLATASTTTLSTTDDRAYLRTIFPTVLSSIRAYEEEYRQHYGTSLPFYRLIEYLSTTILESLRSSTPLRSSSSLHGPACSAGLDITCDINRVFNEHLPLIDYDNDTYAGEGSAGDFLVEHLRGTNWRGRDCNDSSSDIYPGRHISAYPPDIDANCNGIYGTDPSTGIPYEQLYCSGENTPMGIAILGDSATAHFHLPPQYVNAHNFALNNILDLAANEADWPQCSWSTAHNNVTACPRSGYLGNVTAQSIYQRMFTLNQCMHRDYINVGVNGARTGSMAPPNGIVSYFARNQTYDTPMLVFYALIGNDVCNGHPGSDSMTTVQEFYTNVMASLTYLDTVLPNNSHVAFMPLADGRVLYDTTHNLTHPLGVGYPDVYSYLSCSGANPCWGWLNTNETWRNFTSERAQNLTNVYDQIIGSGTKFQHFDMYRLQVDWFALINEYVQNGGKASDVIEPVDGFHPSQTGNYLLADVVWMDLQTNRPQWLPKPNPFNANITALFGNQGGY